MGRLLLKIISVIVLIISFLFGIFFLFAFIGSSNMDEEYITTYGLVVDKVSSRRVKVVYPYNIDKTVSAIGRDKYEARFMHNVLSNKVNLKLMDMYEAKWTGDFDSENTQFFQDILLLSRQKARSLSSGQFLRVSFTQSNPWVIVVSPEWVKDVTLKAFIWSFIIFFGTLAFRSFYLKP